MGNCFKRSKASTVALGQTELLRFMGLPLLWLYGGPCVGKRTQAEMIVETYGFMMLHTDELIEKGSKELTTRGIEISTYLERHEPVPAKITIRMIKESILSHMKVANGFVICDFPPDVETGKLFEKEVCKPTRILFLRGTINTMKKRAINKARRERLFQMLQERMDREQSEELTKTQSAPTVRPPRSWQTPLRDTSQSRKSPKRGKIYIERESKAKRLLTPKSSESLVIPSEKSRASRKIKAPEKTNRLSQKKLEKRSKIYTERESKAKRLLTPKSSVSQVIPSERSRASRKIKTPEKTNRLSQKKLEKRKTTIASVTSGIGTEMGRKSKRIKSTASIKSIGQTTRSSTKVKRATKYSVRPVSKDVKRLSKQSPTNRRTASAYGSKFEHPSRKSRSQISFEKLSNIAARGSETETSGGSSAFRSFQKHKRTLSEDSKGSNTQSGRTSHQKPHEGAIKSILLDSQLSKKPRSSGIHLRRKIAIISESRSMPEIPQIMSTEDLIVVDRSSSTVPSRTALDVGWEQKVQNFYQKNADILLHFSDNITQINAERTSAAVFESVKRAINEICAAKGLDHLIVPLEHLHSRIV